jgi:AAA+ ATPase superfamily predicted ATPase
MKLNAGGLSSIVIGREKELIQLGAYISLGQHVAIIAPRRYGKTTLANAFLDSKDDEYLICKIDVFGASSIREFCELYIDAIYKLDGIKNFVKLAKENVLDIMGRFTIEYNDLKMGYDLLKEQDENELVRKTFALAQSVAQSKKKRMIVFFDEFGDLAKFGQDFIKKLRSYFQKHQDVIYLFAGSQQSVMDDIFLNSDNAFFNFATLMRLGKLPYQSIELFAKEIIINDTVMLSDEAISTLLDSSKGHPFYTIKILQEGFICSLLEGGSNKINEEHIEQGVKKILFDNAIYFETLWQKINSKKYKGSILKELAIKDFSSSDTVNLSYKSQIIRELKSEGIVDEEKQFLDPMFYLWLQGRSK